MDTPHSVTPSIDLLKAIQEFISETSATRSAEEVTQLFRKEGVEFDTMVQQIKKQAERAENRQRLKTLIADIKDTTYRPIERVVTSIEELKRLVEERINALGTESSAMAFYRKLETAEEEDLLSLLDDFDQLELKIDGRNHTSDQ